jgi:predicted kinase
MNAYVMCGIPGSGKTTYARDLAKQTNAFLIEGDAIRSKLFGDASVYGRWGEVWQEVDRLVEENASKTLVLDGTFETTELRSEALSLLNSYGYNEVNLVVMDTSLPTALARNWNRKRNVPDYIVKEKHSRMEKDLIGVGNEGFATITFVK